jgi:hypothetical protein
MKDNQPFKLFVPASIKNDLTKYLKDEPPGFKYDVFDFYFIINYLVYKQVNLESDEEYFNINHSHLETVINSKTDKYVKYLRNGEFIFNDGYYIKGGKPYHYKLNPKFDFDLNTVSIEPGTKLFNQIQSKHRNKRAHFNRLEPHLMEMKDKLMDLHFDYNAAKYYISENPDIKKRIAYFNQIELLADKRLRYFSRNKTNNRLYTPVTNLKKELREFIIGNLVNIDLKNSQPFFLGQLLMKLVRLMANLRLDINKNDLEDINNNTILCCSFLNFDLSKTFGIKVIKSISKIHQKQKKANLVNLKEFADCVNAGNLYEYVGKYFNGKYKRDEIKDMMFKVLFSRNFDYKNYTKFIPYEKEKKVFAEVFPIVAEMVKILKEEKFNSGKHKILPVLLQKIESYIFIDCISKDLVNAGIVPITIHDSIIVERQHKNKAIEIIHNVFAQKFNVIPLFHEDSINRFQQSDDKEKMEPINPTINGYLVRLCPITNLPMKNQRPGTKYLTSKGVQWYYENEPEIYRSKLETLLTEKWKQKNLNESKEIWFEEIAHKIRCKLSNPRRNPVNNTKKSYRNIEQKGLKFWPTLELVNPEKLELIMN